MRLPVVALAFAAGLAALASSPVRADTALEKRGCVACHSTDGSPSRGPTFRGLAGSERAVTQGTASPGSAAVPTQARATVTADRDYLTRSIVSPDLEIASGYSRGAMPSYRLDAAEVAALVGEIEALKAPGAPAAPRSIVLLLISMIAFVGFHIGLSSVPVRRLLSQKLGAGGFQGLYSLLALASFVGLIVGYQAAPYLELWTAPRAVRWLPNVLMPIAWILLVCSVTTKSPTIAGKPGEPPRTEVIGIVRVTRHPMLWAFTLWGLAHIPANGNARALVLFGGFVLLSIVGMFHSDARRATLYPEVWAPVAKSTSVVPFGAILGGRNKLVFKEIGPWRLLAGIVLWAAALHFHKVLLGLSALP
jgi:uncharacterized membrane protein/cytochrome c2